LTALILTDQCVIFAPADWIAEVTQATARIGTYWMMFSASTMVEYDPTVSRSGVGTVEMSTRFHLPKSSKI
jgi:hypothetical protein